MSTIVSDSILLSCLAGVEPYTDSTSNSTQHYTWSENIRFVGGKPEKIGGNSEQTFDNGAVSGKVRTIYSSAYANRIQTIIGTHSKLYNSYGSVLTNITPLQTAAIAIANSLATDYATLANNPITTTNGSKTVRIADANYLKYIAGDSVRISGAIATGGIAIGVLNTTHTIRSLGVGWYEVYVSTAATSTATGGGAAVNRATGLVNVTKATHGLSNGARVKIDLAVLFGGITALQINLEFIIRNVATNTFDVMTTGFATSSVTADGGAATTFYEEITSGNENETFGQGYGMGLYGEGLYGTALVSSSGKKYPRIWFADKFGDTVVLNAGNQSPVYYWDGSTSAAPIAVPNAPTTVNYSFISDNVLVTFGAGAIQNKIFSSAQGDITNWTSSSTNAVFEDNIEGAGRLISHANVNGTNIVFTEQKCYTMRFVGYKSGVWAIKPLENIGIIAPMARVVVNGIVLWMGIDNFYMWRGGSVEIVPSNTGIQSTMLRYVFDNLNFSQKSKSFAWFNKKFGEVWFHYPSTNSNEPDRVAIVNINDFSWCPLEVDRTAAEYPEINLSTPRLAKSDSKIFRHETGKDDNGASLPWSLQFNTRKQGGKRVVGVVGIIPDSIQTGDINVNVKGRQWPQSTAYTYDQDVTCSPTQERIPVTISGRFYQYTLSGDALGQDWQMGEWNEEVQLQGNN